MKKKFLYIAVGVAVFIGFSLLAKNMIAKFAVERAVHFATGLDLKMKKLDIGLFNTYIGIKDLVIYNPKGYKDPVMINIPEIYVDYELLPLLHKKVLIKEMRIDLKEFMVVKNEKGEANIDSLKSVQEEKSKGKEEAKSKAKESGQKISIEIKKLELKIGKVVYKDYSKGGEPAVNEYQINLNEKYENIKNLKFLVSIIVVKVLTNTTIGKLMDFDIKGLSQNVGSAVSSAATQVTNVVKNIFGGAKQS